MLEKRMKRDIRSLWRTKLLILEIRRCRACADTKSLLIPPPSNVVSNISYRSKWTEKAQTQTLSWIHADQVLHIIQPNLEERNNSIIDTNTQERKNKTKQRRRVIWVYWSGCRGTLVKGNPSSKSAPSLHGASFTWCTTCTNTSLFVLFFHLMLIYLALLIYVTLRLAEKLFSDWYHTAFS